MTVNDSAPTAWYSVGERGRRVAAATVLLVGVGGLGALSTSHRVVAFAVALGLAAIALVNARPVLWISLAVALPWVSRLLTTTGLAPRFVDFLDFPLVIVALLVSALGHRTGSARLEVSGQRIARWMLVAIGTMALSWLYNDWNEPQRLLAALVLALEPFLLLLALLLAPMTRRDHKTLLTTVLVVLLGQLPFSLLQIAAGRRVDDVKGTLLMTGAGHHVSVGGLMLGLFLLVGLRKPKLAIGLFGAAALFVAVTADAKQVLFIVPAALLVLGLTQRRNRSGASAVGGLIAGAVMAGGALFALLTYQASSTAFDFIDRSVANDTGKFAVAAAIRDDLGQSPVTVFVGLGPGETVSRFSFLTTPALLKAGSPVTLLGLHESRGGDRYTEISQQGAYTGVSSFTSPQSSILGLVGDYGLVGLMAFMLLIGAVIRALQRAPDRGLRSAALASWTLLMPLALVFDWLEQPPFTLTVIVITGLCLRSRPDPGDADATALAPSSTRTTGDIHAS